MPLGRVSAVSGAHAARLPLRQLGLPQQDGGMFLTFHFHMVFTNASLHIHNKRLQRMRPSARPTQHVPRDNTASCNANIKKIGSQSEYPSGLLELNEI